MVERIEGMRAALACEGERQVSVLPSPEPLASLDNLGVHERPTPGVVARTSLAYIATVASISRYWGLFLHLSASAAKAETIIELGGCAGISGCYLASAPSCRRFVTIEGSPELAARAEKHIRQVAAGECEVINMLFDDGLDVVLPTLTQGIDLAFIDGQHERGATWHYLNRLQPYLHPGSLVIFDDVMWTPDMAQAWREISASAGIATAVLLGRLGVLVWGNVDARAFHCNLSKFTADWRPGKVLETK